MRFFFLLFCRAPYIRKTLSLLPKSLKIITSAPQIPENKSPYSPDPQNPWGPLLDGQCKPDRQRERERERERERQRERERERERAQSLVNIVNAPTRYSMQNRSPERERERERERARQSLTRWSIQNRSPHTVYNWISILMYCIIRFFLEPDEHTLSNPIIHLTTTVTTYWFVSEKRPYRRLLHCPTYETSLDYLRGQ